MYISGGFVGGLRGVGFIFKVVIPEVVDDFGCEVGVLVFVNLLECESDKLFELLDFLIDFDVCEIFLIGGIFDLMNLVFDLCQLLFLSLFYFFFLFFLHLVFLLFRIVAPAVFQLVRSVVMFDFLHFFHQLILGMGSVLEFLHQFVVVAFHVIVVLDQFLELLFLH